MDSFSEEMNPDQKWPETKTYKVAQNICCKRAVQLWSVKSSESQW